MMRPSRNRVLSLLASFAALILTSLPSGASADDETVTFYRSAFLPTTVTIVQGESVHFVWDAGEHTLTSGESSDDEDAGDLFEVHEDGHLLARTTKLFVMPHCHEAFIRQVALGAAQVADAAPGAMVVGQDQPIAGSKRTRAAVFEPGGG